MECGLCNMKDVIGSESLISFIASIALSYVLWRYEPKENITVGVTVFFICVSIVAIWIATLIYRKKLSLQEEVVKLREDLKENKERKAKEERLAVVQVHENNGENNSELILILKPNKLLYRDVFVTVFKKTKNYEEYIATGKVINVQENELVQVNIISNRDSISDIDIPLLVLRIGITDKYFEDRLLDKQMSI